MKFSGSVLVNGKEVDSAVWFKHAVNWMKISFGYNNPLNFGLVHSELMLIEKHREEISNFLSNYCINFFGVGVGDTEIELVNIQLEKYNSSKLVCVDINNTFLQMFESSLKQKQRENAKYKYDCRFLNIHFDNVDEHIEKNGYKKNLVVLGSTIGNYNDPKSFIELVNKISSTGDRILIGYQLDTHIKTIYQKYKNSPYYPDLIGYYLEDSDKRKIKWTLDKKTGLIEAWCKNLQLFRSKKFTPDNLAEEFKKHGYKSVIQFTDVYENFCLQGFEKI